MVSALMQSALADGFVSTPGGYRKTSDVHLVTAGQAVVKRGGASFVMKLSTGALTGSSREGSSRTHPASQIGAWVTWANWQNTTSVAISSFATRWVVPPPPRASGDQLVYLFNGLQDPHGTEILQPVLQLGVSGARGGRFWSIASWHVDSQGHAYCTPALPVQPGDQLKGLMTLVSSYSDGTHNYRCEFVGREETCLMALGIPELTDTVETLEAYGLTEAAEYPAMRDLSMNEISVETDTAPAALAWSSHTMQNPLYGEDTVIVSNASPGGEVQIVF
ncbi:hypothetical protein [Terriglobus sp. ADX1]|uniref:hypothetical protein n=1 Tax=Terriglobus sp. ADX1 TaxID=2794063 RepID=UPI002FE6562E